MIPPSWRTDVNLINGIKVEKVSLSSKAIKSINHQYSLFDQNMQWCNFNYFLS